MTPAIIFAAISAATQLIDFIAKAQTDLKQSGELTPEQEKELDDQIAGLKDSPWWKPE